MFENQDYFQSYEDSGLSEQGSLGKFGRTVGKWLGFVTIFTVLAFSAYHGISATATYRAGSFLGILTGTVGIITVEIIVLSLILRWHNRDISGTPQKIAALVAMAVGFVLSFLAIITDSRLNAGLELTPELSFYLLWILPASPLFMMAMNHIVEELEPGQLWSIRAAEEERRFRETKFTASMAAANAELEAAKAIWNAQLNAKVGAAKQVAAHYQSEEVQLAIRQSALGSIPALLRHIGVDPSSIPDANNNGTLDTGDVAAFLEDNPDLAARLFAEARRRDEEKNAPTVEVIRNDATGTNASRAGLDDEVNFSNRA